MPTLRLSINKIGPRWHNIQWEPTGKPNIWIRSYSGGIRMPATISEDQVFRRLCRDYPNWRLERTGSGEIRMMTPAGDESAGRESKLNQQLANWNDASGSGVCFSSSAGFRLSNGAIRAPDASWIARARWDSIPRAERRGFAPLCPDFVVELRSPTDRLGDLQEKMTEYCANGTRLGWLIDPERRVVEVYHPDSPPDVLHDPTTISGEDVLSGFVLDVQVIFDWN
jgi:Uma2 family endonuclease